MGVRGFIAGIIGPAAIRNSRIKDRLGVLFSHATHISHLHDFILVYAIRRVESQPLSNAVGWADSYILGFSRNGSQLILVPFLSDFTRCGDPIYLLPGNLHKVGKLFVVQGYFFEDRQGNIFCMHVPERTSRLAALLDRSRLPLDQQEEAMLFSELYHRIKY